MSTADLRMLGRQVGHELVARRRVPITLILTIGFPLVFFTLLSSLLGNETIDARHGVRLAQFLAPGMATFGVVMSTFSFLAVGVATARTSGVLKRQSGTPVPRWVTVTGRVVAATLLGLLATALVLGLGAAGYHVQLFARSAGAVVLALLLGSLCFAALGQALGSLMPTPQATIAASIGLVIPLSFVSDVFMAGSEMPAWLERIGWAFPLKHLAVLLGDALNPYLTGSGLAWDHLAALAGWGVAGALLAVWAARRTPAATRRTRRVRTRASDAVAREGALGAPAVLLAQVRHTMTALRRDPTAVFFALAFPVVLVAVIPAVNGGGEQLVDDGRTLGALIAITMAVYGAAVTAYLNMPVDITEGRERRVLTRLAGTPLPTWALLAGRVVGATVMAEVTLVISVGVGMAMYGTGLPDGWAAALGVLALGGVCFALLGLLVASLVQAVQSANALLLGTLIPLAFVSDIFIYGVTLPTVLNAVSWAFPLRHVVRAMTEVTAPVAVLDVSHLVVVAAWTVVGAVLVAWRYSRRRLVAGG